MKTALIIAAVIAALFAIILLLRTISASLFSRRLRKAPQPPDDSRCTYYAGRLSRMIQCRTVSVKDSYDDTEFARLRAVMEELFPLVHQKAERMTFGDDCWVFRLPGRDSSRNILLMSHHDVVDASGEWEHEGFSGEIADGKIWGRGTVDTKTPLFAEFSALEELLSEGFELPCSVWLASSHNEELGGDGIPKTLEYFKEKGITFEVILDEGGAVIEPPLGGMKCEKCAMVAVHEKGRYYLRCTASSSGGHGSLTAAVRKNPAERMAALICEVSQPSFFIRQLNPQVKAMFTHLAPYCGFGMKLIFSNLWCFGGLLTKIMPKLNAQAGGMIGTTCTFSELCSDKSGGCSALAFLRPVDYNDLQKDLEAFIKTAEKHGIEVTVEQRSEYHAPADMSAPGFAYTKKQIAKIFPQYPAAPFILPAGTDARTLTDVCSCVLRFAPIRLSAQQLASVHGENENLDLDAIPACVDFYRTFVSEYK